MRVIVEKPFGRYSIGAVIPEMPGNQARGLIARGLVREDEPKPQMVSPARKVLQAGRDYVTRAARG